MDLKEKMTLVRKDKAIQCLATYGPVFGGGDLAICNRCDVTNDSMTNFASSFNFEDMYRSDQEAWSSLCGVKKGNHFKVVEYEVFKVVW